MHPHCAPCVGSLAASFLGHTADSDEHLAGVWFKHIARNYRLLAFIKKEEKESKENLKHRRTFKKLPWTKKKITSFRDAASHRSARINARASDTRFVIENIVCSIVQFKGRFTGMIHPDSHCWLRRRLPRWLAIQKFAFIEDANIH